MVVTKDLREYDSFWEDIYMCSDFYDCSLKYVIGIVSIVFVVLYA